MALDIIRILLTAGEGIFSLFLGIIILQKSPKDRFNQTFFISFVFFAIFFLAQLPLFIIGSLGSEALPFLPFLNLSRDISNAFGIFGAATMVLVSIIANRGVEILENRLLLVSCSLVLVIVAIIGELNDHVVIDIANATHTLENNIIGLLICFILPLLLFIVVTIYFGFLWYRLEDPVIKRNVMFFFGGMCILLIGLLYQVVVTATLGSSFFRENPFFDYITYVAWGLGQLIMAQGFLRKVSS
ncbi:MAG: hypothetical protein ACFFC7_22065 [Candidatus Hermodarchaeota archaeon]